MTLKHVQAANLLTADWLSCEPVLKRFENAWQDGTTPSIADFAPTDSTIRLAVLFELILTDMEFRYVAGDTVRIESYLEQFPELYQSEEVLTDLMIGEWELRKTREPQLQISDWFERFPDFAERIKSKLDTVNSHASRLSHSLSTRHRNVVDAFVEDAFPTIPGFEIISILGQGGMGIVFEAMQCELGRRVALKVIRSSNDDEVAVKRFMAEAEAAASLRHRNIVQIYSVGEHESRPFLVLELISGETVEQQWADRLPHYRAAAEAIETLANAVNHAHQNFIIHRDLKPSNVLVDCDGVLRITDFGMAKGLSIRESATMTGEILGTPCVYVARAGKRE
ncbi:MAG: serine/threonine-protein kinase [Pirellulaceae bacterium]|nr:serine/threonine-protein kinase [Pirellulaceae bacterium]